MKRAGDTINNSRPAEVAANSGEVVGSPLLTCNQQEPGFIGSPNEGQPRESLLLIIFSCFCPPPICIKLRKNSADQPTLSLCCLIPHLQLSSTGGCAALTLRISLSAVTLTQPRLPELCYLASKACSTLTNVRVRLFQSSLWKCKPATWPLATDDGCSASGQTELDCNCTRWMSP